MKKIIYLNLLVLALFALDRLTKLFFLFNPAKRGYLIWPSFLELKFGKNTNLALGLKLPLFWQYFLIGAAILIVVYFLLKFYREKNAFLIFTLTLILAGAFSNLLDRLYFGYVIDFIDVPFFSVFNLADVYITVGVALILLSQFKKQKVA